ncbi:hypothetical protein P691DRAFT_807302 [Macrolepiota fuliginosa MF-IS2]|uniref:Uncharacterized protein n=1 Tax=Macrolepiota fuliginosa MF-IS2 TaxID=1400762 RepID=A0A9P5X819_9AGAR|nr:hypothetical protein P691DRAFT_807302 [Macrolepiota fuliginosa MF-IS2]
MPIDIPSRMVSTSRSRKRFASARCSPSKNPAVIDHTRARASPLHATPFMTSSQPPAPQRATLRWQLPTSNATLAPTARQSPPQPCLPIPASPSRRIPSMMPPLHNRIPHTFTPTGHRYTPYARVMTSPPPPPISLTVRRRRPARNELRIQAPISARTIVSSTPKPTLSVAPRGTSPKVTLGAPSSPAPSDESSQSPCTESIPVEQSNRKPSRETENALSIPNTQVDLGNE